MLLGVALGILVGVLISFAVVWYLNRTPPPIVERVTQQADMPADGTPKALPGKPGDPPIAENRFKFYEMLEGREAAGAQTGGVPASPAARAFLQVGAFQKSSEADNLRAQLALLGFEANVHAADIPDKGRVYRVRVGPYPAGEEIERMRETLSKHGMSSTVIRE